MGGKMTTRPHADRGANTMFDDEEITLAGDKELVPSEDAAQIGRLPAPQPLPASGWTETKPTPLVESIKYAMGPNPTPISITPYSFSLPDHASPLVASLSVLSGPAAGQAFALEEDDTSVGRSTAADIQIDDIRISRQHARFIREAPGEYYVEDLASRNGTFLDGQPVHRARLFSGDCVHIGPNTAVRFGLLAQDEVALQQRLYRSSTWDALTGALTRQRLLRNLALKVEEAREMSKPLSLLMLDIDHFKEINDSFGHDTGDQMLRALVERLKRALPSDCLLGRLGGEEFVMVLPECPLDEAVVTAQRCRRRIAQLSVETGNGWISMTVSIGVAALSEIVSGASSDLLALADHRMLSAKRSGRNRVCAPTAVRHP